MDDSIVPGSPPWRQTRRDESSDDVLSHVVSDDEPMVRVASQQSDDSDTPLMARRTAPEDARQQDNGITQMQQQPKDLSMNATTTNVSASKPPSAQPATLSTRPAGASDPVAKTRPIVTATAPQDTSRAVLDALPAVQQVTPVTSARLRGTLFPSQNDLMRPSRRELVQSPVQEGTNDANSSERTVTKASGGT